MTKIITICQNKGGVGKTTTVINLAYLLSETSKVLLIDTDSQANLSQAFNIFEPSLERALENLDKNEITNVYENIDIISNTLEFDDWKKASFTKPLPSLYLSKFLQKVKGEYDYILIDTPPSLDISLEMSIYASDYYMIICNADSFNQKGLESINKYIEKLSNADIRKDGIKNLGILFNRVEKNNISKSIINQITSEYKVLKTQIRKSISVVESQSFNVRIDDVSESKILLDYKNLVSEIKGLI